MADLLALHAPDDAVAFGNAGAKTAAALRVDAARVAAGLPASTPGSHVLLVIEGDRYAFTAALLGAWAAGHAVALPPNTRGQTVSELVARPDVVALVHDTAAGGHLPVTDLLAEPTSSPLAALSVPERALTVFTSGTTGESQAWPKTRDQVMREVEVLAATFSPDPGARTVVTVPPSHLYGLLFGVLLPLRTGGAFLRETPLLPEAVASRIETHEATVLVSVPVHLRAAEVLARDRLGGLGRVFSSTAPLHPDTARAFATERGLPITEIFGSTETGGIAWRDATQGEAWIPLPGVAIGLDEHGHLQVDSPFLPPDAPRPWTTADLAERRDDGSFLHRGRADGVVKIGGRRVSLPSLVRWLLAHDGIDDAEVVAVPAPGRDVRLLAVVATTQHDAATLRAAMLEHFVAPAVPRQFLIVDALPREAGGKLPRRRVLRLFGLRADGTPVARTLDLRDPAPDPGDPGTLRARVHIPPDYVHFEGHFDGYPILAGVVQLHEVLLPLARRARPELGALRGLKGVKFTGRIRPGDSLDISLSFTAGADDPQCAFTIAVQGQACSAGVLAFAAAEAS